MIVFNNSLLLILEEAEQETHFFRSEAVDRSAKTAPGSSNYDSFTGHGIPV